MAKRKKGDKKFSGEEQEGLIKNETKHGIIAVVCGVLAIFFILASLHRAGAAGDLAYRGLGHLFGAGFFIIPIILIILGLSFFRSTRPHFITGRLLAGLGFFVSLLGIISILFPADPAWRAGGLIGQAIASPLQKVFATYSLFLLAACILITLLIIFDTRLQLGWLNPLKWWRLIKKPKEQETNNLVTENSEVVDTEVPATPPASTTDSKVESEAKTKPVETEGSIYQQLVNWGSRGNSSKYTPPPLSLLEKDSGKPGGGDIKASANIIKRTLANFGIVVEMDEISIGPSITRFALKPAEGVKLSRIIALQNDLSLALAAHPIRIEAPIPGKSLVGIEIPNRTKSLVGLASLLGNSDFAKSPYSLAVSLGRDIAGQAHFANLAKAPHILIAGTTGSGKSVVIHTFITSLLYRNPPDRLRFIMIDPKRVELTLYNNIPHLLTPVVTNAKKTILALKWAIKEMERRYDVLEKQAVRDIQSYHQNAEKDPEGKEKMPYLVIIIDELADIMSTYPRELEATIVRLAQMSRAVGIHLVLSTQRPSVEVITGLIKANIPARIALQVASQIDSRTIIDSAGAEKLLGSGDMLYLSGDRGKPVRLQSAFISEVEVKKMVAYLVKQQADNTDGENPELDLTTETRDQSPTLSTLSLDEEATDEDDDELYEEAREQVIQAGKASASYLQRKLKVGYARAARLLDMLEERQVIGPGEGAKQREVYIKYDSTDNLL